MSNVRKGAALFVLPLLGAPVIAAAHVRWFVETGAIAPADALRFRWTEPGVQVWVAVMLTVVATAYWLERRSLTPPRPLLEAGEQHRGRVLYVFQVIVGVSLLAAALRGAVLVPHLQTGSVLTALFRVGEGLAGLLFVCNLGVFWGAVLLAALYVGATVAFGVVMSLEYLNLFGIAAFLFLLKAPESMPFARWRHWALPLLRVHLGIAISILAFSEKLLRPEFAMDFLARHQLNFMPMLGFEGFSDRLFVLSAGCSELLFGVIFLLGWVTRLNTVTIAGFLVATNVYFFVLGKFSEGVLELMGHANLVAIALILVFYGAGERLRLGHRSANATKCRHAPEGLGAHPHACEVYSV